MSLGDIKEKLYKKEEEKDLSKIEPSGYDPHVAQMPKNGPQTSIDLWEDKKTGLDANQKKAIKKGAYVLGGVIFVVLVMVGIFLFRKASFSEDRVTVSINGPTDVNSGKLSTYEIICKNDNRSTLNNVTLKISYSPDFKPEENPNFKEIGPSEGEYSIGSLNGYEEKKFIFNGRLYSPRGALIYLNADLIYNPSSYSTQFKSSNKLGVNISTSPVDLEVMGPQYVSTGDAVDYLITYANKGEVEMNNLRIKADYPEGFTYSDSQPKSFEGNNIWYIGDLTPGQSGKIVVSGKLVGEKDQAKIMKVYIGSADNGDFVSFSEGDVTTTMASSPISISQQVNGASQLNANAGDVLRFTINFKNDGDVGLSNVIVTEKLDSPILDYSTMDTGGGFFDSGNKMITWKASDHPELRNLAPGQGGTIKFSVSVKEIIPVSSANDKNFVLSSLVKIDSPDIPTPIHMNKIVAGNELGIKLNSKLVLDVKGYHTDPNITNGGPIPPKVGQETTYTIHWILKNVSNDISNAKVEAVLPTGASMTGKIFPEDANITYNERNNSIVWELGNVTAGTGILSNPKEASFQVKIMPSPDQANRPAPILGNSTLTAKDLFTGDNLSITTDNKTTQLMEDASLGTNFLVVN